MRCACSGPGAIPGPLFHAQAAVQRIMDGRLGENDKCKPIVYNLWTPRVLQVRQNVVLGQALSSKRIKIQSTQHSANMTPNQWTLVEQWINVGAPEK